MRKKDNPALRNSLQAEWKFAPAPRIGARAAYVAAANLLTNPKLDPFGKIPEFKYCAAKVERIEPVREAAE